jgi:hypothetical protein
MAYFPPVYDQGLQACKVLSTSPTTLSHQVQGTVEEGSHAALCEHRIEHALSVRTLLL